MLEKTILQDVYVNQKRTQKEIAESYGIAPSTINYWLKKLNIPRRMRLQPISSVSERLRVRIKIDAKGCWNWTGFIRKDGYGELRSRGKLYLAHRISYELFVGIIPEDLVIDHKCRNKKCVNPNHLEVVTQRENLLRGEGPTAQNAGKTHCLRGHLLFGSNSYISQGRRRCRKCDSMRQRIYYRHKDQICP